jgi:carbonyl reductase 1
MHFISFLALILQFCGLPTMMALATKSAQKISLITGSNKGIGLEIARTIGAEKLQDDDKKNAFLCILGCRNEKLGREAVKRLESEGMDADFVRIDLEDAESIQSAAAYIEKSYGRCDVLINNAAVCFNDPTLYGKTSHTPFDKQADITVRTNFFGTLSLTRAMLPLLEQSDSPRIINIASSAGRLSILPSRQRRDAFSSETLDMQELEGFMREFVHAAKEGTHRDQGWPNTGYGVSKVGIIAMTKILAREYPKFMVNSVDPGYCATDQNNNQGHIPAERGAIAPYMLATLKEPQHFSGLHWYEAQAIKW